LHVNTELFLRLAQKHVWSLLPHIITPLTVFNCSGKYTSQKKNYFYLGLFSGWVTCSWNSFLKHWWSWSLALLLHTIFTDISLSSCKLYQTQTFLGSICSTCGILHPWTFQGMWMTAVVFCLQMGYKYTPIKSFFNPKQASIFMIFN